MEAQHVAYLHHVAVRKPLRIKNFLLHKFFVHPLEFILKICNSGRYMILKILCYLVRWFVTRS